MKYKIILKSDDKLFTYHADEYSFDENNLLVFKDDRGVTRRIPKERLSEIIGND